uniref:SCAN box domain-containing protein n=1 Tax=Leptobrachium leishanense TaxID=445787 RepID=A0A8C5LN96_9ANUR
MSWAKAALKSTAMEELVKQMVFVNVQAQTRHEEAMAQQQQALAQAVAAQQESTHLLAAQLAAQQVATQTQINALREAMQQLAPGRDQAVVTTGNHVSIRASHFLQKLSASDDVEAFLTTFERTAEREGWPQDQWAGLIAPFLTGDPQKAYFDLPLEDAKNYDRLKAEVLARLGVTVAVRAQRVHCWKYCPDQPPRSQMHDLGQLVKKWLQPETLTREQMVERVVMDHYLRSLPKDLQRWVSHGDPKTAALVVEMVERYTVVEDLLRPTSRRGPVLPPPVRPASVPRREASLDPGTSTPKSSSSVLQRPVATRTAGDIQCWRCRAWGHTRAQCPLQEEPMECGSARRVSFYTLTTCTTHLDLEGGQFECTVWVNHRPAKALLDSGSMVTLVHARVVGRLGPVQRTLRVVCIHGDTREYPLIPVTISANTSVTQEVGVVSTLIHDVIVGRDCPLFAECLAQTELPIELGNNSGSPPPNMTVDTVDEELLKCVQNKNVVTDVSVLAPQPELTPKE